MLPPAALARLVDLSVDFDAASALLPLVGAGCAFAATGALEKLRARFIYTEEAKALQHAP